MINCEMRYYNYSTLGALDRYGQPIIDNDIKGTVKMAVFTTTQAIQDNVNYKGANYIGLTMAKDIADNFIIHYGDIKLKVLYVNPVGRFNQVFMVNM